jgi:hypothetical protein
MGFFWLSAFFFVYCARPEDWFPGLKYIPCAKVTAILAMWGLFTALGKTKRTFKDVPKEGKLLLLLIGLMFVSGFLVADLEGRRHQSHHRFFQGVDRLDAHLPADHRRSSVCAKSFRFRLLRSR